MRKLLAYGTLFTVVGVVAFPALVAGLLLAPFILIAYGAMGYCWMVGNAGRLLNDAIDASGLDSRSQPQAEPAIVVIDCIPPAVHATVNVCETTSAPVWFDGVEAAAVPVEAAAVPVEAASVPMPIDYGRMTVPALRALCDERGVPVKRKDRKADLIAALTTRAAA